MSDKLLDKLDETLGSDDDDEDADSQNVNDALGDDEKYWKSRNQAKKAMDALKDDDEDED